MAPDFRGHSQQLKHSKTRNTNIVLSQDFFCDLGFVTTTFPQNSDFLPNEKQNPGYFVDFYVPVVGFKLHELMKNELFGLLFEIDAEGRSYKW